MARRLSWLPFSGQFGQLCPEASSPCPWLCPLCPGQLCCFRPFPLARKLPFAQGQMSPTASTCLWDNEGLWRPFLSHPPACTPLRNRPGLETSKAAALQGTPASRPTPSGSHSAQTWQVRGAQPSLAFVLALRPGKEFAKILWVWPRESVSAEGGRGGPPPAGSSLAALEEFPFLSALPSSRELVFCHSAPRLEKSNISC